MLLQVNEDSSSMIRQARRTRKEYQGKGIASKLEDFIMKTVLKRYPNISSSYSVEDSTPFTDAHLLEYPGEFENFVHIMRIKTTKEKLARAMDKINESDNEPRLLPMNKLGDIITPCVIRTLFQTKYFTAHAQLTLFPANVDHVKDICRKTTTFYSPGTSSTTGISFGSCSYMEAGPYYIFQLFCEDTKGARQHVLKHLEQAANVLPPGVESYIRGFTFRPEQVPEVAAVMSDGFGEWMPGHVHREQLVIFTKKFTHKL